MTLAINLEQLSNSRALVRKMALRALCENLTQTSDEEKSAIFAAARRALRDESRIVQREAIKTLLSFAPDEVPEELASLRMETLDEKMRSLAHGAIARIETNKRLRTSGIPEWNNKDYIFSVSDFLVYINTILGEEEVCIKGEISDIKTFRDNLTFFNLKDDSGVVGCWFPTVYKYQWNMELSEGIEVVVFARSQISPKSGQFKLRILEMRLSGAGALAAAFQKLKVRLESEGLFDHARKRPLPFLPDSIGLITGENSAAYSDFIKVLRARMGGIKIYFTPVRVQGVGSIAEVCGAISCLNKLEVDCIALTRGGGSMEDLQAFNSEEVTRAVFSSRAPIVVAIGHEKDLSLAEFAGDVRASTPSNAAEIIAPNREELLAKIMGAARFVDHTLNGILANKKRSAYTAAARIGSHLLHRVQLGRRAIARFPVFIDRHLRLVLDRKESVNRVRLQCLLHTEKWYTLKQNRFLQLYKLGQSYSPKNTLKRGYSIVKLGGKILHSSNSAAIGDEITVYPYEGVIVGEVKGVK